MFTTHLGKTYEPPSALHDLLVTRIAYGLVIFNA